MRETKMKKEYFIKIFTVELNDGYTVVTVVRQYPTTNIPSMPVTYSWIIFGSVSPNIIAKVEYPYRVTAIDQKGFYFNNRFIKIEREQNTDKVNISGINYILEE